MSVEDAIKEMEALAEQDRKNAEKKVIELALKEVAVAENWGQVASGTTATLLFALQKAGIL